MSKNARGTKGGRGAGLPREGFPHFPDQGNPATGRSRSSRDDAKGRPEGIRVENRLVARRQRGRCVTRDDSIWPGLARVCGITDEITAGILGTEGNGKRRGATRSRLKEKKFSPAENGKLNSCCDAILPALSRHFSRCPFDSHDISPRTHWHSSKICVLICNLIGKPPSDWTDSIRALSSRPCSSSCCFPSFLVPFPISEESWWTHQGGSRE